MAIPIILSLKGLCPDKAEVFLVFLRQEDKQDISGFMHNVIIYDGYKMLYNTLPHWPIRSEVGADFAFCCLVKNA